MLINFLRPIQDPNMRIMASSADLEKHVGGGGRSWSSFDSEEEMALSPNTATTTAVGRRKFKAYTVMQRSGFQHTEYVQILTHLCKAEILISLLFLSHGLICPGFTEESAYQGTCHINVLSALVGLFTGAVGMGAVHRFRWRTMLVCWLIMCIISAVANLLAVITTGVWLDHLSKLKTRTGLANGLSGLMLLGSVLVGVCFILTSVLLCHYWASNSTRYQPIGRVAKRTRTALKRRSSRAASGNEKHQQTAAASMNSGGFYGQQPGTSSSQQHHHHHHGINMGYQWEEEADNIHNHRIGSRINGSGGSSAEHNSSGQNSPRTNNTFPREEIV